MQYPMDTVSLSRLQLLHPKLRAQAVQAYNEAVKATPANIHPVVSQTLRTFQESDNLYQQGRTKPGPIVTKAQPGQSYHNYGLALDFFLQIDGKESWKVDDHWMQVVNIFKKHGFTWGGDWTSFKDYPHLENRFGYNWRDLLKLHNEGKVDAQGYVLI